MTFLVAFNPINSYLFYTYKIPKIMTQKNRQHNGQKKKYNRTNNDLLNIHIKLKID